MRAMIVSEYGPPDRLRLGELPEPALGDDGVRIAVRASSINFADVLMVQGKYQERPPFPFSPGLEVAGDVLEVGPDVAHVRPGQRVAALVGYGGFAEQVVAPAAAVLPIPDAMDYVTAAGFVVVYGTSHIALTHRAQLRPGETLLVHGAAGGVGLTAVELGHLLGARVIATAGTPEKRALAESYGAAVTIDPVAEDLRSRVREITAGRGADVIYDPVGGDLFDQSLRCIAWEGRLLVIGFASGRIPGVPANLALVKNCSIVGVYWGAYLRNDPGVIGRSLQQLLRWYADGRLRPHISATYPLEEAPAALNALLARQTTGKIVLTVAA